MVYDIFDIPKIHQNPTKIHAWHLRHLCEEPREQLRRIVVAEDHVGLRSGRRRCAALRWLRNPGRVEDDEVKGCLTSGFKWFVKWCVKWVLNMLYSMLYIMLNGFKWIQMDSGYLTGFQSVHKKLKVQPISTTHGQSKWCFDGLEIWTNNFHGTYGTLWNHVETLQI